MRDRFFYPLALIVIAAIVALAVLPGIKRAGQNNEAILRGGFVLAGADLRKLTAAPTTFIDYVTGPDGAVEVARAYGNMPRDMAPASAGVFGTLSASYLKIFAGQTLEVSVTVRQASGSKTDQFDLGIFTPGAGSSGWKKYTLTDTFQKFGFTYEAPASLSGQQVSYVGIWPGDKGDSEPVDIQSMTVTIVQP